MTAPRRLLAGPPRIVTVGADSLADALAAQGAQPVRVDWRPSAAPEHLAALWSADIDRANAIALGQMLAARPRLVGVRPARDVVPGLGPCTVLHAGPPIAWPAMSGPLRGAIVGALLYEGLALTPEEAEQLAAGGGVEFAPCHSRGGVGPMAGVTTASMPVLVVEDETHGGSAWATLNEGLGAVLRYGAFGPDVQERLAWLRDGLGPLLGAAIARAGGVEVGPLIAQALHMGDECHNRNRAASALLARLLAPHVAGLGLAPESAERALAFLAANDHFFLNVAMAAAKLACDTAHGVPGSSLVTAMARNGTEFGIRVSGLGDRWWTGPAAVPDGLYFAGYGPDDANPDIGDSAITETAGHGGFAMAAAPAIVQFVGGTAADALAATRRMYEITLGEHPLYRVPALDFRGTPVGIDVRLVAATGILPQINTGIAHRTAGIGQIGAGLVTPPGECFDRALAALAASLTARR